MYIGDSSIGEDSEKNYGCSAVRPAIPVDVTKNNLLVKVNDSSQFNHFLRSNDRLTLSPLVDWLQSKGFDAYLGGSVISDLFFPGAFGKRLYGDIDVCAVTPVGGDSGYGIIELVDELAGVREDGFLTRVEIDAGRLEYAIQQSYSEPSFHSDSRNRFILSPTLLLPSGENSKKSFSLIDLNFYSPSLDEQTDSRWPKTH